MPLTYEPIATTTLGSAQSSVTFSSISGSFTDLILVISATTSVNNAPTMRLNNDTGNNYSNTALVGNGSAASSNRTSNQSVLYYGGWISGFDTSGGNAIIHLMNYSNTTTNKTILNRFSVAGIEVDGVVGLWRNTAAINRIDLSVLGGATYSSGSTFTLYGIKAA
jgi:hypothetical protein